MNKTVDEFKKQARKYADDFDFEGLVNSIDFSKVDTKKLKKVDFSKGIESARHQLEQMPRMRLVSEQELKELREQNEGGFIGSLLLGMVLGAILALLFAPKSGHDTREAVVQTVGDLKDKVASDNEDDMDLDEVMDVASEDAKDVLPDEPAIERNFG